MNMTRRTAAVRVLAVLVLAAWGLCGRVVADEAHVAEIVAAVQEGVACLKAADPEAVPMAFWDFDGTIIKGDIGLGLEEGGVVRYPGIIRHAIVSGFTPLYAGEEGYRRWLRDYEYMSGLGRWLSQGFDAQMFAGTDAEALDASCARWIAEQGIPRWYFKSSVAIWKALERMGVENYVVSANIESLVRNTAPSLGIPRGRVRATRVAEEGGRLTTRILYPIPHGEGKVEAVRELVQARPRGVAVAGFGNSYSTDGAFLRYIATQRLPGGARPVSMMINGGAEPARYRGLFRCVAQDEVVGPAADAVRAGGRE